MFGNLVALAAKGWMTGRVWRLSPFRDGASINAMLLRSSHERPSRQSCQTNQSGHSEPTFTPKCWRRETNAPPLSWLITMNWPYSEVNFFPFNDMYRCSVAAMQRDAAKNVNLLQRKEAHIPGKMLFSVCPRQLCKQLQFIVVAY